jgi:hypothetical protein
VADAAFCHFGLDTMLEHQRLSGALVTGPRLG